jgi:predicted MFS family arabinose efflux permease
MSSAPNSNTLDSSRSVAGFICLFVMGPMFFLLMPLYIGALVDHLGFSESQSGMLASTELLGTCVASVLAMSWIRRVSWRLVAVICSGLLVTGNVFCFLGSYDTATFVGLRLLTGFAAGCLVSLACAGLGDTSRPDRNFALGVVGQLALSGTLFFLLPSAIADKGASAIFGCFALCAFLAMFGAILLPPTGRQHAAAPLTQKMAWKPLWGLFGGAAFFIANTAVWAYIERIGVASQLDGEFIGQVLGFSVLAALLGPLIAFWIDDRVNRFWIMLVAFLGELVCLAFLEVGMSMVTYAVIVGLYQFCWNLWIPFQMSVVASVDITGRFAVLIPLFQAAGIALGPALAATFLLPGSYLPVVVIGGVFAALARVLFIPVTLRYPVQNSPLPTELLARS